MEWQVDESGRYEKRVCWHNIQGETEPAPRVKINDLSGAMAVNFYIHPKARKLQTHLWPISLVVPPSAMRLLLNTQCSPVRSLVYQGDEKLMVNCCWCVYFSLHPGFMTAKLKYKMISSNIHMDVIRFCEFILLFRERYCCPPFCTDTVAKITALTNWQL